VCAQGRTVAKCVYVRGCVDLRVCVRAQGRTVAKCVYVRGCVDLRVCAFLFVGVCGYGCVRGGVRVLGRGSHMGCVCACLCTWVCANVRMWVCVCVPVDVCACVCACGWVCECVYTRVFVSPATMYVLV